MKIRRFLVAFTAVFALTVALEAKAYEELDIDEPSAEAMTFDLLIVRPMALAGTIVGMAVFVVALPISLINLNVGDPARRLVLEPLQYTFTRELGDLN